MKIDFKYLVIVQFVFLAISLNGQNIDNKHISKDRTLKSKTAIAIHGGAGNIIKKSLSEKEEQAYMAVLDSAVSLGHKLLENGVKGTDVVVEVIKILEDSPLFNAGKGSVFSNSGINEMDAAIMDGQNLKCGAVTNLTSIKNPIELAHCIMQKSKFIFLNGQGAEQFAKENNIKIVDPKYFFDKKRWEDYLKLKDSSKTSLDHDRGSIEFNNSVNKYGTVGCVVLDSEGNLAAGTSTGGITNKKYNRIGDSPLIGAGTYANNKTCAVSCTGRGEDFIKIVAAHQLHNYIEMKDLSIEVAAQKVIEEDLERVDGRGGLIAINKKGKIVFKFNTKGMFRASFDTYGTKFIAIY
jgi:beta-aspartyl-peptidase (threonine type)